jgi:hypothetical protein
MRIIFLAFFFCAAATAAELEGVRLEDSIRVDGEELVLNGIGLRTRMFFKVYVGGLYFGKRVTTTQAALEMKGAKRVIFVMLREASAEQFVESIDESLKQNSTPEEQARIKPHSDALYAMIRNIGLAKKGMRIVLDYTPSNGGTTLIVDGAAAGKPMLGGEDHFRMLLRIWVGEHPAQEGLKRALLRPPLGERP